MIAIKGVRMLLHAFIPTSRVNGPGVRSVIFFQGCNLGCRGCHNPKSHAFLGKDLDPRNVAVLVLEGAVGSEKLDGVTFSGGEPMQQAQTLLELMRELRREAPGLSFGMFTGYSEQELEQGQFFTLPESTVAEKQRVWAQIRAWLDFAVMGRYNHAQPCNEPLRTSRNQCLRLFSGRYHERDFTPLEIEIVIDDAGGGVITGFPTRGLPL